MIALKEPVEMDILFRTVLPETKKLYVKIVDDLGGNAIVSIDVNITVNRSLINDTNID